MKKIVSLLLALSLLFSFISIPTVTAEDKAEIYSNNFSYTSDFGVDLTNAKEDIKSLNNGDLTQADFAEKYSGKLKELKVNISGIKNLNDIYGLQFRVSANTENIAFAFVKTNLQNNDKVGVSLWESYTGQQNSKYNSALVLMYGAKPINGAANEINKISSGEYHVASIYYLIAEGMKEDFEITYAVEDIASKNADKKVESITGSFEETSKCTVTYNKKATELTATMLGAQVRTSGKQGIRFGTRVEKDKYYKDCKIKKMGTLIAVTKHLGNQELQLDSDCEFYDCPSTVLTETEDYIIFTGEIRNFPKDGKYDNVNFTATAYIEYEAPDGDVAVQYFGSIVRNVGAIKSRIGIK